MARRGRGIRRRSGRARARRARRARHRGAAGGRRARTARARRRARRALDAGAGLRGAGCEDRRPHRDRVLRAHDQRRPAAGQEAGVASPERRRPAAAEGRRLRRARDPWHRQVRRAHPARGLQRRPQPGQEHARVPGARVRAVQARLPRRQALRADRPARPALEVRRRRGADAVEDGRKRLGTGQGPCPPRRARHRGRAGQALLRAHGGERPRVRPRHAVAARARGGVPLRRDAGSAADDR